MLSRHVALLLLLLLLLILMLFFRLPLSSTDTIWQKIALALASKRCLSAKEKDKQKGQEREQVVSGHAH